MADTVQRWAPGLQPPHGPRHAADCTRFMRRRSTVAFLMCLPLILHHRRAGRLSGLLFDLSVDAEQGADALHRARQFPLPALARRVLDGGAAVGDLRALGGVLQGADRADHRASRSTTCRPRASASGAACCWCRGSSRWRCRRSAGGGCSTRPTRRSTGSLEALGFEEIPVAQRSLLGALLGDPGQRLVRRAVLPDHVSGGAQVGARTALRGRRRSTAPAPGRSSCTSRCR